MKKGLNLRSSTIFFALVVVLVSLSGCNPSPAGPSAGSEDISSWMPCVGVHAPGFRGSPEFEIQVDAVRRLQMAGRVKWIRVGYVDPRGDSRDYVVEFKSMGLKIFTNISLEQLERSSSWEDAFEQFYHSFPEVDIWEIAGEVTNSDPSVNIKTTTPEYYVSKFKQLYTYVKRNYPGVTLASAPTVGSVGGPRELETFFNLGLLDTDAVIALNLYTENALQQYASVFDAYARKMSNKRIWVPETGVQPQSRQIWWVQNMYPKIQRTLRPEMMCWYILWDGDRPIGITNGLLNNLYNPPVHESELFKRLTRGYQ